MNPREKFDLLLESLKDIQGEFLADNMKVIGFLLIAIGWLVTSEKSRAYLKSRPVVGYFAIGCIIIASGIHVLYNFHLFNQSAMTMALIDRLELVERIYYEPYLISSNQMAMHIALCSGLTIFIGVMIARLKDPGPST